MVSPIPRLFVWLTGRRRGRVTATGKIVIQVEERADTLQPWGDVKRSDTRWIDATRAHVTACPRLLELPDFDAGEPPRIAPPPKKP